MKQCRFSASGTADNGHKFALCDGKRQIIDCGPYIPYPEVVSYIENQDGTITLEVNAVWPQKELDQAFCHSVTIRLLDKDRFQYVSNYVSRSEIEVTWYTERLSDEKWEECYGDN